MSIFLAEGIPIIKQTPTIQPTAVARLTPKSIKFLTASSSIEINDEKPAKVNPRKNRIASGLPNDIFTKSCGIHIKVNPVDPGPEVFMISKISGLDIFKSLPRIEKTVLKIIIAANSDTKLLPIAVVNACLIIQKRFRI